MTFATSQHSEGRRRGGFTLIELLVVVGIILLLMGILLPAVSKIYSSARASRTKADLLSIATALEAYKSDYNGSYPVVTTPNTGAAVLGKALIGAYDAAHYYTLNATNDKIADENTLHNPPPAYVATQTYQAGDVVLSGAAPTFTEWVTGQAAANVFYVSIKNDNQADGTPHPTSDFNWWAPFSPYDGNDGPGGKNRLGAGAVDSTGVSVPPHAPAGTTFGPYLNPDNFRLNGINLLDAYGSPILYFPVNKAAKVTSGGGLVAFTPPVNVARPLINADDNLRFFFNEAATPAQTTADMLAKIKVVLGDYNQNGGYDSAGTGATPVPESAPPTEAFVLWTAGPDKKFGPRGTANPATFTKNDFYQGNANASENATAQAACDDVTNFR